MHTVKENFWDTRPHLTGLVVLAGIAALSMSGGYVPSKEFGKLATFTFWFILAAIASTIIYWLRYALEYQSWYSQLNMLPKILIVWVGSLLIFSPFSELIDMAIGITVFPDIPANNYHARADFLFGSIWHEITCAAIPMLYILLLFDMLWFSRMTIEHAKPQTITLHDSAALNPEENETLGASGQNNNVGAPPVFLTRSKLPDTATILHIEAQQHYIMVKTNEGHDLIYYRFGDAIAEMKAYEGLQVHRSHWVANEAITKITKQSRKMEVHLFDEQVIPVSRNHQPAIIAAGWLKQPPHGHTTEENPETISPEYASYA